MKAKTIQQNISAKVNDWALSIKNKQLQSEVIKNSVVTGGCIASMFLQESVNDYDVYFTKQSTVFKLAVYYINEMQANTETAPMSIRLTYESHAMRNNALHRQEERVEFKGKSAKFEDIGESDYHDEEFWSNKIIVNPDLDFLDMEPHEIGNFLEGAKRVEIFISSQGFEEDIDQDADQHHECNDDEDCEVSMKYRPAFLSSNAITLSHKMQLVLRFVGTPEQIHETYDFVHATNYWTDKEGLVTNQEALEALLARELVYRGSKYPLASIFRTRKFIQRGWNLHIGNYIKMAIQLNDFDLTNEKVLEEQLTGVDSLYMRQVINAINIQKKNNPGFEYNSLYVCELCDRIMGIRREIDAAENAED